MVIEDGVIADAIVENGLVNRAYRSLDTLANHTVIYAPSYPLLRTVLTNAVSTVENSNTHIQQPRIGDLKGRLVAEYATPGQKDFLYIKDPDEIGQLHNGIVRQPFMWWIQEGNIVRGLELDADENGHVQIGRLFFEQRESDGRYQQDPEVYQALNDEHKRLQSTYTPEMLTNFIGVYNTTSYLKPFFEPFFTQEPLKDIPLHERSMPTNPVPVAR